MTLFSTKKSVNPQLVKQQQGNHCINQKPPLNFIPEKYLIRFWRHRLAVRTLPSQGENRGSIPRGATIEIFAAAKISYRLVPRFAKFLPLQKFR